MFTDPDMEGAQPEVSEWVVDNPLAVFGWGAVLMLVALILHSVTP